MLILDALLFDLFVHPLLHTLCLSAVLLLVFLLFTFPLPSFSKHVLGCLTSFPEKKKKRRWKKGTKEKREGIFFQDQGGILDCRS